MTPNIPNAWQLTTSIPEPGTPDTSLEYLQRALPEVDLRPDATHPFS